MQRDDHDVGPEAGAVLADPPAFVLEPAVGGGDLKLPVRLAGGDLLRGVEHREVPSDDLICSVALEALRARIPRGDAPVAIKREDRVVRRLRDQQGQQLRIGRRHPSRPCPHAAT